MHKNRTLEIIALLFELLTRAIQYYLLPALQSCRLRTADAKKLRERRITGNQVRAA